MSRGFASNYRIVLLAIGLFGCFAGLGARLMCLHVLDREELLRTIVKTRHQDFRDTAQRGDILDTTGARLATSRPMILVAVDPSLFRAEDEAKLPDLARLLNKPLADVRRICLTKFRTVASASAKPAANAAASAAAPAGTSLKLSLSTPPAAKRADDANADDPDADFATAVATNNDETPAVDAAPAKPAADDDTETDATPDADGRRLIRWAKLSDEVTESTFADIDALNIRALCPPERRYARVYPHGELAAHVVGYTNKEGVAVDGIEKYADFYLRGRDGWREGEKDGRKRELAQFQTRDIPRADGYSVVLSLDVNVQDIVEQELQKIAKTYQPLKATIIVSNPRTGFILAMGNYPTFNPNDYNLLRKDEMSHLKNVAVTDVYEPGSVFKIVAASAALQEGLVTEDTRFNCSIEHMSYAWHDPKNHHGDTKVHEMKAPGEDHHWDHPLSVAEIISHSSNRGAAQLAMMMGEDKFEAYARAFGFGDKTGFPIGHEVSGLFKHNQDWYPIDITRIPMGQSIAATALQMHMAMSTIANGGMLLRPQIVRQVRDTSNNIVYQYSPAEVRQVVSAQTARRMAKLLQGVAGPNGTAPNAAIKINGVDYEVAGKTGTAQKYMPVKLASGKVKLVPSRKNHVVSFVGFFPASRPQVAISVIVDDADAHAPGGVAYGAAVAAPVFKSIGEKLIPILPITAPNQTARLDLAALEGGHR